MGIKEKNLPIAEAINDGDKVRIVTADGESKNIDASLIGGGSLGRQITVTLAINGVVDSYNEFQLLGNDFYDYTHVVALIKSGDDYSIEVVESVDNPNTITLDVLMLKEWFAIYIFHAPEDTVVSGDAELVHFEEDDYYFVKVMGDCTITARGVR